MNHRPSFRTRGTGTAFEVESLAAGLGPALMADGLPGVDNHQAGAVHRLRLAMMVNGVTIKRLSIAIVISEISGSNPRQGIETLNQANIYAYLIINSLNLALLSTGII